MSDKVHLENVSNPGQLHRAIALAEKMKAAGLWDGQSDIYFSRPSDVAEALREAQLTGELVVPAGIYRIEEPMVHPTCPRCNPPHTGQHARGCPDYQ